MQGGDIVGLGQPFRPTQPAWTVSPLAKLSALSLAGRARMCWSISTMLIALNCMQMSWATRPFTASGSMSFNLVVAISGN